MLLTALTDGEFLRHAEAQHDTLTASAIETEILRRFARLYQEHDAGSALRNVLEQHDITEPAALAARLEQPDEWAGKPIGELHDLLDELEIKDHGALRNIDAVFTVAIEFDLDTPDALRTQLARIQKFDDLMNDLAAPLKTLTELAPA